MLKSFATHGIVEPMRFGPYESVREIGRGGLGMVFVCRGPGGREVAVKVLHASKPEAFARFERERRILAQLGEDQGFVGLVDAGSSEAGPWIAMPFCRGGTLRNRLEHGPLGVDETVSLGSQLASALGKAHARGIVHRDMKPENVLFKVPGGPPLIADLGIAKHFDHGQPGASQSIVVTKPGGLLGTAGYMSPEQGESADAVGPPADVFALGAILHECLTGSPAFRADSVVMLLTKVMAGEHERLERPDVPPWLAAIIEKTLSVDPGERFADGEFLAEALRLGPRWLTALLAEPAPQPPPRRRRWPVKPLAGLGLLVSLSGGVALALRHNTSRSASSSGSPAPASPAGVTSPKWQGPQMLPRGLRRGPKVKLWNGVEVNVYLWSLPGEAGELELVHVPGGDFVMGCDGPDTPQWEKPRHVHRVPYDYWIG
jgi:serine/threonine protein kinase